VKYQYSGTRQSTLEWPAAVAHVRAKVEAVVGHDLTHALVNRYRDGRDYIGWHSDSRTGMQPGSTVACISLGATRAFQLRDRAGGPITEIDLTHASLIIMGGRCQQLYRHSIPRRANTNGPRYSITLRQLLPVLQ
jgi:alkylated DNA repair dioxygenase AlkB